MKIKLFGLVVILSFFNVAFADSVIEKRTIPRRSAIQSTNMVFTSSSERPVYNVYNSAIKEIQNKISQNPNDYSYYVALIELYLKSNQNKQAYEELVFLNNLAMKNKLSAKDIKSVDELRTMLSKSVRYERNLFWLYINLAMTNLIMQDSESAIQCIISASRNISDEKVLVDALGKVFDFTGDYNSAIQTIDKILLANPSNIELRKHKANYLVQIGKTEDAVKEMVQVLLIQPNDNDTKYSMLKLLTSQSASEKDILKKLYPNKVVDYQNAYFDIAELFMQNNDLNNAKEYAAKLVKKYPENANGYILLSEIYKKEGNLKDSMEALSYVRDKADNNEQISKYNVLLAKLSDQPTKEADSLMNNGLYAQALNVLESSDQNNLYVILGMARANYFLENKQTSFELLNKAMSLYPNNPDVFYYFAYILFNEGDIESSRNYLSQAFKVNPNHQFSLHLLDVLNKFDSDKYVTQIISAFDAQNYEESMRLINEALSINKKDSGLYYYQGLTYIAMNNYAAATAPLYKAIDLDKKNTLAYFYLGLSFDNLSEPDNALAYYRKFIELLPSDDYGESEKLNYAKSRIEKLSK